MEFTLNIKKKITWSSATTSTLYKCQMMVYNLLLTLLKFQGWFKFKIAENLNKFVFLKKKDFGYVN